MDAISTELQLFAYYYPWYTGPENRRFLTWNRHYPPLLGFYRSDEPRVIDQHLDWAEEATLNGFLIEWFGTASGDGQFINDTLVVLRERFMQRRDFRYAIFYDQAIRFGGLDFSEPDKRTDFLDDIETIAAENFNHPNYWHIDGRPVLVIYLTRAAGAGYGSLLDEARERARFASGETPFIIGDEVWWSGGMPTLPWLDAVTAFNLHSNPEVDRAKGDIRRFTDLMGRLYRDAQRDARRDAGIGLVPGLLAQYNDESVRSNLPLMPAVVEGELPDYRGDMVNAMRELADLFLRGNQFVEQYGAAPMFINSFNEWPERSSIEPSSTVESFNELTMVDSDRRLLLPGHGHAYLDGVRDGRRIVEALLRGER